MNLLTQIFLLEKHGPRVNLDTLAKVLDTTPASLRRKISDQTLDIPTYVDGGRRWADVRDVAEFLDNQRALARSAHRVVHQGGQA